MKEKYFNNFAFTKLIIMWHLINDNQSVSFKSAYGNKIQIIKYLTTNSNNKSEREQLKQFKTQIP